MGLASRMKSSDTRGKHHSSQLAGNALAPGHASKNNPKQTNDQKHTNKQRLGRGQDLPNSSNPKVANLLPIPARTIWEHLQAVYKTSPQCKQLLELHLAGPPEKKRKTSLPLCTPTTPSAAASLTE